MILELVELVGCFIAGGGATLVVTRLFNKNDPESSAPSIYDAAEKNADLKGTTMKWACINGSTITGWHFICPKCDGTGKKQPPICECDKYYNTHYHFVCSSCKYTNVMRTKDDP
jgi:hypothetical protein